MTGEEGGGGDEHIVTTMNKEARLKIKKTTLNEPTHSQQLFINSVKSSGHFLFMTGLSPSRTTRL
jgi:hypothetical protein